MIRALGGHTIINSARVKPPHRCSTRWGQCFLSYLLFYQYPKGETELTVLIINISIKCSPLDYYALIVLLVTPVTLTVTWELLHNKVKDKTIGQFP